MIDYDLTKSSRGLKMWYGEMTPIPIKTTSEKTKRLCDQLRHGRWFLLVFSGYELS